MKYPAVDKPHEVDGQERGKNLGNLSQTIRGEGISQPQSIAIEIISPRDRAAHGN